VAIALIFLVDIYLTVTLLPSPRRRWLTSSGDAASKNSSNASRRLSHASSISVLIVCQLAVFGTMAIDWKAIYPVSTISTIA